MKLTQLTLQNFRNISTVTLEFSPGINILLGANGQGKTNLLEAIFTLSLSRPFRSREQEVFLTHGADFGKISGIIELNKKERETLEIFWGATGKKVKTTVFQKNGVQKTSAEFLKQKHFFAVLFAPEDMELPFAPPKKRRQFLAQVLSPIFPEYFTAALKYEKVLRHRNRLLQDFPRGQIKRMEFDFWDAELVKWTKILEVHRQEFFAFVAAKIAEKYQLIAKKKDILEITSEPSVSADEDFFQVLEKSFRHDVRYGATQKGPHRDDFRFILRGKPLEETASRGEVRSAIIALKLCERDFVAAQTSFFPVLILDDVFSELDEERREALLKIFQNDQVFISTTHLPELPKDLEVRIFKVREGKIQM